MLIEKPKILSDKKIKESIAQIVSVYRGFEKGEFTATELRGRMNGFKTQIMAEIEAQNDYTHKEDLRQFKLCILQAIADELEYPSDMPDELWNELDGNRYKTEKAMQLTVRLTKNGITDRFLQALQGLEEGGVKT